jgi:hypothetical protein
VLDMNSKELRPSWSLRPSRSVCIRLTPCALTRGAHDDKSARLCPSPHRHASYWRSFKAPWTRENSVQM